MEELRAPQGSCYGRPNYTAPGDSTWTRSLESRRACVQDELASVWCLLLGGCVTCFSGVTVFVSLVLPITSRGSFTQLSLTADIFQQCRFLKTNLRVVRGERGGAKRDDVKVAGTPWVAEPPHSELG